MKADKTLPSLRLSEPPGIEGFLTRVRPKKVNDRVYLSSHDGHIFVSRPSTAHPPDPPSPVSATSNNPAALVLAPFVMGFASIGASEKKKRKRDRILQRAGLHRVSGDATASERRAADRAVKCIEGEDDEDESEEEEDIMAVLNKQERIRAYQQISDARGFFDLQDVVSIEVGVESGEIDAAVGLVDVGGPEGLATSEDKALLLRQRSFVLKLKGGASVRFEVRLRLDHLSVNMADPR